MNTNLTKLHPYPFAKMGKLLANSTPAAGYETIKLGIGEPKHQPPEFVLQVLEQNLAKVQNYPTTNGMPELRDCIASWLKQRFELNHIDANGQILPVMGTREAIFSFVQAAIDTAATSQSAVDSKPLVVMPNPFYQIYEGAALLAGAEP